jgi:hypothetical protein
VAQRLDSDDELNQPIGGRKQAASAVPPKLQHCRKADGPALFKPSRGGSKCPTAKAAALRKAAYLEVLAVLAKLPENERFTCSIAPWLDEPRGHPVNADRMSTQELLRRLALGKGWPALRP